MGSKIIYIAGYGRSGSTLLEKVLSDNDQMEGLGEAAYMADSLINPESYCACGKKVKNCKIWSNVLSYFSNDELVQYQNLRKNFEGWKFLTFWKRSNKAFDNYLEFSKKYFDALESFNKISEERESLFIDSSKTTRNSGRRPFIFSELDDVNVYMIHLVRDVRGCIWSNMKGSNRKIEKGENPKLKFPFLRTLLNWKISNYTAEKFGNKYPDKYLRVTYESFVNNPRTELNRIGLFLNVNLDEQIEKVENSKILKTSHQIAGNRMRNSNVVHLKMDDEWQRNLPWYYKKLASYF